MSDLHKDAASEKPPARHSTGPRTKAGKAVSSRNSRTHGCCSKQLVIQGESQEEFDELLQDWMEDYRPRGKSTRMLVQDAAEAQWVLNRNRNRYNDLEASLQEKSALEWTEEDHKEMQRCLRYRTTAERSFSRALNTLEQVAKRRRRQAEERDQAADEEQEKREDAEEQVAEVTNVFKREITDIEIGAIHVLDQWVDVERQNGKTVTKLDPSNEQLLEDRKIMKPPPEQVRRRFDFRNGIPDEYEWCLQTEEQRTMRQWAVQQITVDTWLEAIEREKASGTGHLSDTGEDLPDPKRRTWCYCKVCARTSETLWARKQELERDKRK
jgi:hypothetical protein